VIKSNPAEETEDKFYQNQGGTAFKNVLEKLVPPAGGFY
jgi:hypothetical protein